MRPTCESCALWGREREHDNDYPYGTCRAKPPRATRRLTLPDGLVLPRAVWPWTAFDDYCGAHVARIYTSSDLE